MDRTKKRARSNLFDSADESVEGRWQIGEQARAGSPASGCMRLHHIELAEFNESAFARLSES